MKKFALCLFPFFFLGCTSQDLETSVVNTPEKTTITEKSQLTDFFGKPSLIVFGGTYCPHCRDAMPTLKSQIWEVYQNDINLWVNVIDQKKFDVQGVPQGFNPALNHGQITGTPCGYVPSWIVLDKTGKVVKSECGGGSAEAILSALKEVL